MQNHSEIISKPKICKFHILSIFVSESVQENNVPSWARTSPSGEAQPFRKKSIFFLQHTCLHHKQYLSLNTYTLNYSHRFGEVLKEDDIHTVKFDSKTAIWTQSVKFLWEKNRFWSAVT